MMHVKEIAASECASFFSVIVREQTGLPAIESDVANFLRSWTLIGIFTLADKTLIGVIGCDATGDTHVHVTEVGRGRWHARSSIRRAFALLLARHRELHVTIPRENSAALKIARFVGADVTTQDDRSVSYTLRSSSAREVASVTEA